MYYYYPVINFPNPSTVPPNATREYTWIIVGGVIVGPSNQQQVAVKWNNTKNYNNGIPIKTIKVKIKFTWDSSKTKEITSAKPNDLNNNPQNIEVKHISAPSTLTLNGTSHNNGNIHNLSCGAQTITLSGSGVYTDPFTNDVTFYWYFPSGWPVTTTTTSTFTYTTSSSINTSGKITVEVKRFDSTIREKIEINITRPLPTKPIINSNDILLCNPQTITATASNATAYYWSSTGGISASSPGNTNSAYLTGTSDGTVKVAAYSDVCQLTTAPSFPINVKRSAPYPASLIVYNNVGGSPDFMCRGYGLQLSAYTNEPGTNFSSWTTSNPANTYLNFSGGQAYFNSYINDCYGIDVTASNCFGSVQKGITICVDDCGSRYFSNYTVYPNPVKDVITISLNEEIRDTFYPDEIRLYDEKEKKPVKTISFNDKKSKYKIALEVSELPRGVYYLHMTNKEGLNEKMRVMIE